MEHPKKKTIRKGLQNIQPGPRTQGGVLLPQPLPAGQIPTDDSKLWLFVPKSVQRGEEFIQDDTREWFEERDRKVAVAREYLDHPRWVLNPRNLRERMLCNAIVSEVHLLVRVTARLPPYPAWVPIRMSLKQQQADVAFRLTKAAHETFLRYGPDAMEAFALKAPAQFVKFLGATFIPKKLEATMTHTDGRMDNETADSLIEALSEELKRRAEEAKLVARSDPMSYDAPRLVVDEVRELAQVFSEAAADKKVGASRCPGEEITKRLSRVRNLLDPEAEEAEMAEVIVPQSVDDTDFWG